MPTYKLSYFNARGRAEVARLMFHAAGKEFQDERLEGETWQAAKPNTPYGQLPVLTVDKVYINQSGAIFRYLAREFDLYGKDNMESTKCDIIFETISEVFMEMVKALFEKDETKKAELLKNVKEVVIPKMCKFLTLKLKENGGQFFVGSKLTFADLTFLDVYEMLTSTLKITFDGCPELKGHFEKIANIPNIKKWLGSRPVTQH